MAVFRSTLPLPAGAPPQPAAPQPAAPSGSIPFRRDIQGLRGLAVLLVVGYHASVPGLSGGFVGVDVFFVLSGYLITSLLVAEAAATGRVALGMFYARRIRRLLPAAATVILATVVASAILHAPHVHRELAKTAVAAGAYVSNLWLGRQVGDYFGRRAESDPLLHMWSLSVEEQFYLLWPVLVLAGLRGTASRHRLGLIMVGVILFSLAGSWWYSIASRPLAFYFSPLRAWEFAAGGLLSLAPAATRLGKAPVAWIGAAGLAAVIGSAFLLTATHPFPGLNAVPVVVGTLLLLWRGHVRAPTAALLGNPVMQRLGELSYSWYLWHWPVLVFVAVVAPDIAWTWKLAAASAALLPAALAYRYIETPVRHQPWLAADPRRALAFGLCVTAAVVGASLAGVVISGRVAASPEYRLITDAEAKGPLERDRCVTVLGEDRFRECAYGTGAGPLVVLLGDSHASHWGAGLLPAVRDRGGRLVVMTKSSCPAADYPIAEPTLGRRYHECERWRDAAFARIAALRPDLILVANSRGYVHTTRFLGTGDPYAAWETALRGALERLSRSARRVVVLQDTPWMGHDVPDCLATRLRLFGGPADCAQTRTVALDARMAGIHRAVAAQVPNVAVADLTDRFCSGGTCPAVIRGVVAYRDGHHVSVAMAASLEADLGSILDRHLPVRMAR